MVVGKDLGMELSQGSVYLNGPRQIKRAWCQLEWVHRFRAPRRLPELHKRSARPDNCQRPTERVRPDGVENSCHAIACGERERFGAEDFGGIIDDVVAAGMTCKLRLSVAGHCADHLSAKCVRPLNAN